METQPYLQTIENWLAENRESIIQAIEQERTDMEMRGLDISKGNFCAGLFKYFDRNLLLPIEGTVRALYVLNQNTGQETLHSVIEINGTIIDPTFSQFNITPEPSDLKDDCLVTQRDRLQEVYGLVYSN